MLRARRAGSMAARAPTPTAHRDTTGRMTRLQAPSSSPPVHELSHAASPIPTATPAQSWTPRAHEDSPQQPLATRAECYVNADLTAPSRYDHRHQRVDTGCGEYQHTQCDRPEADREPEQRKERCPDGCVQRTHIAHQQRGFETEGAAIPWRAEREYSPIAPRYRRDRQRPSSSSSVRRLFGGSCRSGT